MNIIKRVQAPTPDFFKKLRNISLILAAGGGTLLSMPIEIPSILAQVAGFMTVAGSVGAAVSQAVTTTDEQTEEAGKDGA